MVSALTPLSHSSTSCSPCPHPHPLISQESFKEYQKERYPAIIGSYNNSRFVGKVSDCGIIGWICPLPHYKYAHVVVATHRKTPLWLFVSYCFLFVAFLVVAVSFFLDSSMHKNRGFKKPKTWMATKPSLSLRVLFLLEKVEDNYASSASRVPGDCEVDG